MGKLIIEDEEVANRRLSWDVCFYDDMINHDGFIISEPATLSFDGKKEKTMYGPNSNLFGTSYGDEQEFMERHRCKCGAFKGLQFKGEICPFCNEKVEARELDIKKTAWMTLGSNVIINPYWYIVFSNRLIGRKIFPEIVDRIQRVDADGNVHELEKGIDYEPLSPFAGIGVDGFYERYEEILTYFMNIKKDRSEEFERALREKHNVFTHHIPVYSKFMRPSSVTSDTFYYNGIDKEISPAYNLSESLKDCEPIEKPFIQTRLQGRVNNMWAFNFDMINSKKGFIRNKLISGSLNYTSRCVICPDPTLEVNEVDLSYQAFRILFKYRIIYYLMKIDNIPLAKAYYRWKDAYRFDPYLHKIMMLIIKREKVRIILNRNPTINLYSVLELKIRRVKDDWQRTTLSVPLYILPGLNADQQIAKRSGRVVTHSRAACERLTSGVCNSFRFAC